MVDALSREPLRRRFHKQVGAWFEGGPQAANDLRELIRALFAWLPQERGVLPDSALWDRGRLPDEGREREAHEHVNWGCPVAPVAPVAVSERP